MSKVATLKVQYCGGWGYLRFLNALTPVLEAEFPGQIKISPLKDPGTTGNFEITLMETGELIHSKSKRGQGKCESNSERAALCEKIRTYLDA